MVTAFVTFQLAILIAVPSATAQTGSELYQQAQRAMSNGDYSRAIEAFRQLVQDGGRSAPVLLQLGICYYQTGQYDDAAVSLRAALEIQPALASANAFLGLTEASMGQAQSAITLLEKALAARDPAIDSDLRRLMRLRLGQLCADTGRLVQSESTYASLLKDYPDDPQILYESFWLHLTRAREAMATLLRVAPASYRTHQMLGYLLAEKRNFDGAAEQFRLALKDNPSAVGLHCELGNMLFSSDPKGATRQYEEELRLHPAHAPSYYRLAELAVRDQQWDRAWELYSKALQSKPNYADAMVGLAKIRMSQGRITDALPYASRAMKLDPANRSAHYLLSRVYRLLGRTADSKREMAIFEKLRTEAAGEEDYLFSARAGGVAQR